MAAIINLEPAHRTMSLQRTQSIMCISTENMENSCPSLFQFTERALPLPTHLLK